MNTQQSSRPGRSWKRFSIRALLVCTMLVAFLLARWSSQRRLEQEIVQMVREHGGQVGYHFGEGRWGRIREWCASLHLMKGDMYVELYALDITSSEGEILFDRLGRRGDVDAIGVHGADDEILEIIGQSLPGLKELHAQGPAVTDVGLASLHRLEDLEILWLDDTSIIGCGFANLRNMSKLEYLDLTSAKMTDAGVAELIHFPNLLWISLEANNQLTKASERHLGEMKSLRSIDVGWTAVIDGKSTELWTLLPKLERLNGLDRPAVLDHPSTEQRSEQSESKPTGSPRP